MKNNCIDKNKHYYIQMRPINIVPMIGWAYTSSSDPEKWVECEIVEDRYKVKDGYKVTLQSIEEGYGREHFYQTDFESLLKSGYVLVKEREEQHVELMKWYEPLTPTVNVQHEVYVVVG